MADRREQRATDKIGHKPDSMGDWAKIIDENMSTRRAESSPGAAEGAPPQELSNMMIHAESCAVNGPMIDCFGPAPCNCGARRLTKVEEAAFLQAGVAATVEKPKCQSTFQGEQCCRSAGHVGDHTSALDTDWDNDPLQPASSEEEERRLAMEYFRREGYHPDSWDTFFMGWAARSRRKTEK